MFVYGKFDMNLRLSYIKNSCGYWLDNKRYLKIINENNPQKSDLCMCILWK